MDSPASPAPEPSAPTPPARRGAAVFVGRVCFACAGLGLAVTAVALLTPFRTSADAGVYDGFATIAFFARVFPWPAAVVWLALAVASAACGRRKLAALCGVLAVAWVVPELWMAWPRTPAVTGPTFSVASLNMNKDLKDAAWAVTILRKMDADLVVLQEVSPHSAEQARAGLADAYPYAAVFPDASYNGMAVFSKTPLTVAHPPDGYERRDLGVIAHPLGHDLHLIDVHLAPPQHVDKRRRNRWQTGVLLEELKTEPRPTMLVGDFNATALAPQAFALRAAGFADARLQAGRGRQATWPSRSTHSLVPTVRIDTAYARGPLRAVASEVGSDVGSDHLPIKTTWQWTTGGS